MHVCDSLQYIREVSVYWKSPQYVFRGPGFGKFEGQDSGFLRKRGRKFRIVIITGMQDLAILCGGNQEMKPRFGNSGDENVLRKSSCHLSHHQK